MLYWSVLWKPEYHFLWNIPPYTQAYSLQVRHFSKSTAYHYCPPVFPLSILSSVYIRRPNPIAAAIPSGQRCRLPMLTSEPPTPRELWQCISKTGPFELAIYHCHSFISLPPPVPSLAIRIFHKIRSSTPLQVPPSATKPDPLLNPKRSVVYTTRNTIKYLTIHLSFGQDRKLHSQTYLQTDPTNRPPLHHIQARSTCHPSSL